MWRVMLSGVLACAGCDKGTSKAPTAVSSRPGAAQGVARLVAEPGGELSIDDTGRVVRDGTELGIVSAGGELSRDGKAIAAIDADGHVEILGWGPGLQLEVRADGTVVEEGVVVLAPRADGTLAGTMLDDPALRGVRLALAGPPASHRALVFAWLALARSDR